MSSMSVFAGSRMQILVMLAVTVIQASAFQPMTSMRRPDGLTNTNLLHTSKPRRGSMLRIRAGLSFSSMEAHRDASHRPATTSVALSKSAGYSSKEPSKIPIKEIALVMLVFQNACQMLSMRYSRIVTTGGVPYLASTAVVASETLKVLACIAILVIEFGPRLPKKLWDEIVVNWMVTLKVGVPAIIYMVQNNLLFIAASNLDAATCQITYQLKILTTAVFAVTMLGKRISAMRWFSLVVLVAGIVLVQLPSLTAGASKAAVVGNPVVGLAAVIAACFLSGFAGVWLEKILKGSDTSIWIRNIQLGGIGALAALAAAFAKDGAAIQAAGFFQGYTPIVWSVICQVGLGGIIVALVVRYADNILKGFATSLSIIVSGLLSMYVIPSLKFSPSPIWFAGTTLVLAATVLYSLPDAPPKEEASASS